MRESQRRRECEVGVGQTLTAFLVCAALLLSSSRAAKAQTFTLIYRFTGTTDGGTPFGDVVRDSKGRLFGTAYAGGTGTCEGGCGTVFMIDGIGKLKVLHSFQSDGTDGINPRAGVVRDGNENLYGTTSGGGAYNQGTVFMIDRAGKETVLHSFNTTGGDGAKPDSGVTLDKSGTLYGTTSTGGAYGKGTVFSLTKDGHETVLHSFTGTDGSDPGDGGVILDGAGSLYGTTRLGGHKGHGSCDGGGCGIVFEISNKGKYSILHRFSGPDGANPDAGLFLDKTNTLYGATVQGGPNGDGTIFKVDRKGKETVLFAFDETDGSYPSQGLVQDNSGNLYGSTLGGGSSNKGVLFEISQSGQFTTLHSFDGTEGGYPGTGYLVRDAKGSLYGTTYSGGEFGKGVVFKLTP